MENMAKPKVTVIMSAYNSEQYVAEAINSVLNQTMKEFELVIVNDASKDGTGKICRQFAKKDKRIRYFERKTNKGKSRAVNFAFGKAKGAYACIFDADDTMVNYKLEVSSKILDKHVKCGLVYGNAWVMNEKSEITGPLFFPSRAKRSMDDKFPDNRFSYETLAKSCTISQGTTMFRMKAIKKVGGLDENLPTAEDWDLWLRISEKFKVFYIPVPLYIYRVNPKGLFSQAKNAKKHELHVQIVLDKIKERRKKK